MFKKTIVGPSVKGALMDSISNDSFHVTDVNSSKTTRFISRGGRRVLQVMFHTADICASFIPFGDAVMKVCYKVDFVKTKFHHTNKLCNDLLKKVKDYETVVNDVVERINDISFDGDKNFVKIIEKTICTYVAVLHEIQFRCDKWLNKNFTKQMMGCCKYSSQFKFLQDKIEECQMQLLHGVTLHQEDSAITAKFQHSVDKQSKIIFSELSSKCKDFEVAHFDIICGEFGKISISSQLRGQIEELKRRICDLEGKNELSSKEESQKLRECLDYKCSLEKENNDVAFRLFEIRYNQKDGKSGLTNQHRTLEKRMLELIDDKVFFDAKTKIWKMSPSGSHSKNSVSRSVISEFEKQNSASKRSDPWNNSALYWAVHIVNLYVDSLEPGDSYIGDIHAIMTNSDITKTSQAVLRGIGNMLLNAAVSAACHYFVTVQLVNGSWYTLERTAESNKANETCPNERSGVHLYKGKCDRISTSLLRNKETLELEAQLSMNITSKNITLGHLKAFCDGQRSDPYSTISNNCKHFCYKLMQEVFHELVGLSYNDFTARFNTKSSK
jgi:hypothetical protein